MEIKDYFAKNSILAESERIVLRKIEKHECIKYLEVEKEGPITPTFEDLCWNAINTMGELVFTIAGKTSNEYLGYISLKQLEKAFPEIGIAISPEQRRMGYATEAVKLMTETVKNKFGISEFLVRIYSDNIPSKNLFSKFNVEPIGEGKSFLTTAIEVLCESYPEFDVSSLRQVEEDDKKSGRYIEQYKLYS